MTIDEKLKMAEGRPTGFDYLRVMLACAVIAIHSITLSYGPAYSNWFFDLPVIHAASLIILPMFFSLSGFLVSGSLDRAKSVFGFLGLRAIRIYPALAVEVLLSAIILGPIFSELTIGAYVADPLFWRYLVNVTGHISFLLPGVFLHNPGPPAVNGQLWTVPYELYCYAAIAVLAFFKLAHRPIILLGTTIALQAIVIVHRALDDPAALLHGRYGSHVTGVELVIAFLAGISVYRLRGRLPAGRKIGFAAGVLALGLLSLPAGEYLAVFVAAYFTICLGVENPKKVSVLRGADYSYGIYLYGWPVQQALVATGDWARHAGTNLIASLTITCAVAALSWHMIEKPALGLRSPLKRIEEQWIKLWKRSLAAASRV